MTREFYILLLIDGLLALALFVGKTWLKANIEASVQHKFNSQLEALRAELSKSEELFKQELRTKETEISALRDGVLGGRAARQALLDKRKLEAVDRVWAAFLALAPYRVVLRMMSSVDLEKVSKAAPRDPNIRKIFALIGGQAPDQTAVKAKGEQLFLTPLAWAYFSAYQTAVMTSYLIAKALENGLEANKFITFEPTIKILKAALPTYGGFIDEHGFQSFDFLLEELEENLLRALREILEGHDVDTESVARSSEIIKMVNVAVDEQEKASQAIAEKK